MTTKALLFTVHYKVYSNYVFKFVYTLYKKLNGDGVEVMDTWLWIYVDGCGCTIMDIELFIYDCRCMVIDPCTFALTSGELK